MPPEISEHRAEGLKASPAFPVNFENLHFLDSKGMTMRQYAAIAAMQGLLADHEVNGSPQEVAGIAVKYADALLEELAKPQK